MSAKCKLCPSCVDGRCFFVPDIYDSEFPCQSPAWDDFFPNGGARGRISFTRMCKIVLTNRLYYFNEQIVFQYLLLLIVDNTVRPSGV